MPVFELRNFNTLNIEYEGQLHIKWNLTNMEWVKVLRWFESYSKCNVDATAIALLGVGLNVSRMFFCSTIRCCSNRKNSMSADPNWNMKGKKVKGMKKWTQSTANTDYCRHCRWKRWTSVLSVDMPKIVSIHRNGIDTVTTIRMKQILRKITKRFMFKSFPLSRQWNIEEKVYCIKTLNSETGNMTSKQKQRIFFCIDVNSWAVC